MRLVGVLASHQLVGSIRLNPEQNWRSVRDMVRLGAAELWSVLINNPVRIRLHLDLLRVV